ncbi:MAG: hypothetical protein KAH10_08260 [Flavobacteriales bacterium]|nr:hypothetical protein [Flavobacteriales bacterium]
MASKRILKKNVNYLFGDLIDECYLWMLVNPEKDDKKATAIVDEAVEFYDDVMEKVNSKDLDNAKKYFGLLNREVEDKAKELVVKINTL